MFLPTKAHSKEIIENQPKIRLGNRVPKDAVNLAYSHVPAINSVENILITDLSDTILENTMNDRSENVFMYPNNALLLSTNEGRYELPTEDVLITNVFKNGVPLYYSYQLTYRHYDNKGPDPYGIYEREGITVIDQFGEPIDRPYEIQLIPDTSHLNLYHVIVYTSFHDKESDSYRVLYNAIDIKEDGRIETIAGYREPLTLQRAFRRSQHTQELIDLIERKEIFPTYYQSSGEQASHSKLFVPTPQIEDTRVYEKFRYQVGVEITTPDSRIIYSSPWYSDSVINPNNLNPEEQKDYVNGFKKITNRTTESIMKDFTPHRYFNDEKVIRRYFVNINNPRVKESMRIDGSSEVFVSTYTEYPNNDLFVPKNARVNQIPIRKEGTLRFKARPLYGSDQEELYLSFVIDNSESMGVNDPEKVLRLKMMESLLYSARDYYKQNYVNGYFFNYLTREIREEFETGEENIIDLYSQAMIDSDVTNPIPALRQAIDTIDQIPSTYITDEGALEELTWTNRKVIVLITDGEFGIFDELEAKIIEAKEKDIFINVITYQNHKIIQDICMRHGVLCIDATSPRLAMELRYFFFQLSGMNEYIEVAPDYDFSMTPDDNDRSLYFIERTTFPFPNEIEDHPSRYGVEVEFDPYGNTPELSIYLQDVTTKMIEPTINGSYIITLESMLKNRTFQVYARSVAYDYSFSPTYSVKFNDKRRIQVLPPREMDQQKSWFLRIRNGRFDRIFEDRQDKPTYLYAIPEYYRQSFLEKGHPYKQVTSERPIVLNHHQLKLLHYPLYIQSNGDEVTNLTVMVNGRKLRIRKWQSGDGIIEVDGAITVNDEVYVDYQYEEEAYTYRGYFDKESNRFWQLDLNPSKGHFITVKDTADGEVKDVPTFTLINKTIYIYLRPCARIEKDTAGHVRPPTEIEEYGLFHTFDRISDSKNILLGEVRVRPNSNQWNIELTDTRTRGGGLKEEITESKMKEYEEDSLYYWDVGNWDGTPYPENGVIAVRVTQNVLKEYGGIFTKPEIEDKLDKYLGYGILSIIEYVDEPDQLLQVPENLVVEVIDVDEAGELIIRKPTFDLSLEDTDGKSN